VAGAVCDGVFDNAAAINAAITQANAVKGIIQLPSGVCLIKNQIFRSNVSFSIRGAGQNLSTIKADSSINTSGGGLLNFNNLTNSLWEDLTIDVNNASNVHAGLYLFEGANIVVRRVGVSHSTFTGFVFESNTDWMLEDCSTDRDAAAGTENYGILVNSSVLTNTRGIIRNCRISNTGAFVDADQLIFDGNQIHGSGFGSGFNTAVTSKNNVIVNNVITGGVGVDVNSTAVNGMEILGLDHTVANNVIYNNAGAGVSIFSSNSIYSGNTIYNNGTQITGPVQNHMAFNAVFANATPGQNGSNNYLAGNNTFDTGGGTQTIGYNELTSSVANNVLFGNQFSAATPVSILSASTRYGLFGSNGTFSLNDQFFMDPSLGLMIPKAVSGGGKGAGTINLTGPIYIAGSQIAFSNIAGIAQPGQGGTGTSIVMTQGSVPFIGASGIFIQNNSKLFFDNTNFRLGIGTAAPTNPLHIVSTAAGDLARVQNTGAPGVTAYIVSDASGTDVKYGADGAGNVFLSAQGAGTSAGFYTEGALKLRIDPVGNAEFTGGNISSKTLGKTLVLKQGANGAVGTFVCTGGGTITISNTNIAITDVIAISLNTLGGTITTPPATKAVTAATSFQVLCGATDTSTYNYALIKNAP